MQAADGFTDGWHYTAPLATMPVYLGYLQARFERAGGTLEVSAVTSLAGLAGTAPVIVNCSGAAAHDLVPDPAVVPVRRPGGDRRQPRHQGVPDQQGSRTAVDRVHVPAR